MKMRSMNSTRPHYRLVPGIIFLPARDWNTIRDTMPPMYSTPTGIRSRSYIRASVKAVIAPVTANASVGRAGEATARRRELGPRELSPQLTAFFTSAPILALVGGGQLLQREGVGHMLPSSRLALSLKPTVAYLALNVCALWKKQ